MTTDRRHDADHDTQLDTQLDSELDADLVVERWVDLDLDADQLWDLVATADGWRRWLVDGGEVDLRDGGSGQVVEGDVERQVRVLSVERGRGVTFRWWDQEHPQAASEVTISIVHGAAGRPGLAIVERVRASGLSAAALASRLDAVRFAWEVRACVAWAGSLTGAQV